MAHNIHSYAGQAITVTFDKTRCIHAGECVRNLHAVFDTSRRRWLEVDNAPSTVVANVVMLCPTGALHYEGGDVAPELVPAQNTITIAANGPIYVRGNVSVRDSAGNLILRDTRIALCRCGKSANKPFCDEAHKAAQFSAPGMQNEHRPAPTVPGVTAEELTITIEPGGPYRVQGKVSIYGPNDLLLVQTDNIELCRCGNSDDKPYCDGMHNFIKFIDTNG